MKFVFNLLFQIHLRLFLKKGKEKKKKALFITYSKELINWQILKFSTFN